MHIHTYTCTYILIHYILTTQIFIEIYLLHMWDYFADDEQWKSVVEYVNTCVDGENKKLWLFKLGKIGLFSLNTCWTMKIFKGKFCVPIFSFWKITVIPSEFLNTFCWYTVRDWLNIVSFSVLAFTQLLPSLMLARKESKLRKKKTGIVFLSLLSPDLYYSWSKKYFTYFCTKLILHSNCLVS